MKKNLLCLFIGILSVTSFHLACTKDKAIEETFLEIKKNSLSIEKDAQDIIVNVMTNSDYEVIIPKDIDWISKKSEVEKDDKSKDITFAIKWNRAKSERTGNIIIKSGEIEKKITINQKADTGYEGNSSGDIKDDIKVPVNSGKASSFQPGGEIEKSFDGDFNTLYHSKWANSGANYFPITLEYFFENQPQIDYLVYHPRSSGPNGLFKEVEIWIKTKENPNYVKEMDFDFKGSSSATRVTFKNVLKNPTAVKFVVKSGVGDGQGFASCAEMEFYRTNSENFDSSAIFTDSSCSELKAGITEEQINQISNTLYRNIAYYLYKNEYPSDFRIQEYKAYPHPDDWAKINKTSQYSLLDNPTGISVGQNEELIVFVGETDNRSLSIKIQNLDKPGGDGYDNASFYPLSKGVNKITTRNAGLIYVLYHTPEYATSPKIKIHFATGKVNGYFDSQKHSEADWNTLLNAATDKYFDVVGQYAHLTFPVESFKSYTGTKGKELIDLYDDLVKEEQEFMGIQKYGRQTPNRAYFHVMYHSYMYSTSYRTAYNLTTVSEILNPTKLKSTPWGPAHELGHTHQTRPTMKWQGTTEVTTNIHSLWIQTRWGNKSRLDQENRYNNAYKAYFVEAKAFHEANLFERLVNFWQLQLYFANAKDYKDFYKDMYEKVRTTPDKKTAGEQQLDFVRKVCQVSETDLTEFFAKHGFLHPVDLIVDDYGKAQMKITQQQVDDLKNEIGNMNYPKPDKIEYITDSNWTVYKNKSSVVSGGKATVSGKDITIPNNWKNAVAFEVYEGDKLVGVVSDKYSIKLDNSVDKTKLKIYAISYNGTQTNVPF